MIMEFVFKILLVLMQDLYKEILVRVQEAKH